MKRLLLFSLVLLALLIVLPASAQPLPIELAGVDGFKNSCDPGINVGGITVRVNQPGTVRLRGQAYADYYNETTVIGHSSGGGELVSFTANAPKLPENSVVQYTVTVDNSSDAVYVAFNCTTGQFFLERVLGSDGRLYAGEDLPVVIYPKLTRSGEPFLDFYTVNANGRGERSLRVSAETLADLPEKPARNTRIASTRDGLATLYKLTSGEFQVNYLPNEEGRIYVVIFDSVSPAHIYRADYGGR